MLYLEENRDFGDSAERAQQLLVMHQAYGERAQVLLQTTNTLYCWGI